MLSISQNTINAAEEEGVIDEILHQKKEWRVYFLSTYWTAKSSQAITLFPGDVVRVIGRNNITLLIEPIQFDHN